MALSGLSLPNGELYVRSRRSGSSGTHDMIGHNGEYRGLEVQCDHTVVASNAVSIVSVREPTGRRFQNLENATHASAWQGP